MKITRLLKRQGLCVLAGIILFAGIFSAYTMAQADMPSQRAFDATAASIDELTRDPGNAQESDADGIVIGQDEAQGTPTVNVPVAPETPTPAANKPVATAKPNVELPVDDYGVDFCSLEYIAKAGAGRCQIKDIPAVVTETLNCQYPLRPLLNGNCDNSDPCDPTTIKVDGLWGNCRN